MLGDDDDDEVEHMLMLMMIMKMMRMAVNIQMRGKPLTLVFAYQPGVAPYGDKPMWVQIFLLEKPMWCGSKYSCFLHKATFRLIVTYFFLYKCIYENAADGDVGGVENTEDWKRYFAVEYC